MPRAEQDSPAAATAGVVSRFGAFVAERFPFALTAALAAFEAVSRKTGANAPAHEYRPTGANAPAHEYPPTREHPSAREFASIDAFRKPLARELARRLATEPPDGLADTTPGTSAADRLSEAAREIVEACDGFLHREAIAASLTREERREMLRGMLLTRATDNRLKTLFSGSEVRYQNVAFQGKGFRSLGQEAIYAAAIRLRRGDRYRSDEGSWRGDVVGPIIRDAGVALAMRPTGDTVRMILNAQMGKSGPPMDGKDLHIGDLGWGILPATAPLSISTLTIAGMAIAFGRDASQRVAVSFIGEGGSSLGEWHEAINACAARRAPAIFCVQNNQTALSTPVTDQSAVRVFADKAVGYGVPGITIDGTDPDAIAAAFTWAADRARDGKGPALIELVSFRFCGHAHHDDMLYLGREPQVGWDYPTLSDPGYGDRAQFEFWTPRDPIRRYAVRLIEEGLVQPSEIDEWKVEIVRLVDEQARAVIEAPWPDASNAGARVLADEPRRTRVEVLDPEIRLKVDPNPALPDVEAGPAFDRKGHTFLEAVMLGVGDALRADPRVFVYGQDVGGRYGNAFLLLRPLLEEFGDRLVNAPLAESAILGIATGAALAGLRPIAEIQFNDFVATGFNQLVNNAAKIRYRWGASVPIVVRMPWGGLRHAGPFHSQNTEPWFYRTPGLKIVVPSTPHDARALVASSVLDPDPVLFYEHIALYRDPRIKQVLPAEAPAPLPIGRAALRRRGDDLAIISYGAYVHAALRVADALSADGIEASVLDLRSLSPLDRDAVLRTARHCSRVLIVQEDSRTGGIGESLAAIIQEEAFESLDAPVRILGALDTPVPYSPPLEDAFLPSEREIERAARLLVAY